jgi:hypothetical protein
LEIQKVDKGQAHNSLIQTSDLKSAMSRVTLWRELWRHKHPSAKAELNLHLLLWHLELSSAFDLDKTQKRTKIEIFHSNPDIKTTISQAFSFFFPSQKENSEPISMQKTISVYAKKSSLQQELSL